MKKTNEFSCKYFWPLDREVPPDYLAGFEEALGKKKTSSLRQAIHLLKCNAPLRPKAYITSALLEHAGRQVPQDFLRELSFILSRLENQTRQQLGSKDDPLFLTVQGDYTGAIRNIGCSPKSLPAMIHHFGSQVAYTMYVDFLQSFSSLVLGCPHLDFHQTFGFKTDRAGNTDDLAKLRPLEFSQKVEEYQNLVSQKIAKPFPSTSERQLLAALIHCARAAKGSPGGDEIFVEAQLVRTMDPKSIRGLAYTRNPFTGKPDLYGVFQCGEHGAKKLLLEPADVIDAQDSRHTLRNLYPEAYATLKKFLPEVEGIYRDVMEAEFVTDADGRLSFTGFHKGETSTKANVVSAIELNMSGKITDVEAALRIKPKDLEVLLHPTLDDESRKRLEQLPTAGVTAALGTAVGRVFFKMADAMDYYRVAAANKQDKRVILIADELLISDTPGLGIISGLVTKTSGISSHAAVMARANGIPCIVGLKDLQINSDGKSITIGGREIPAGTMVTLEASSEGRLFLGEGKLQNLSFMEGIVRDTAQLISRVIKNNEIPLEVRVNINGAKDAETGLAFGADGVGLCRTENMFMEASALREIRNIVYSKNPAACRESLEKLEEIQFQDFKKIFEVMRDRTVNIRLMDLPLHDFVPQTDEALKALCEQLRHLSPEHIRAVGDELREHNPMLGLRACRFGLITPEVYDMQLRAIVRAAYTVGQSGVELKPGIMFPLVFTAEELIKLSERVVQIEKEVREAMKLPFSTKIRFKVGSMIELPAAALSTDRLARVGEFFAFGTNDLTQTTLGMSRDDSAHYLPAYLEKGFLANDPFKVLHEAVRELVDTAVRRGRRTRGDASFGICGEQGGDPASLRFCLERELNYVSCSPFRVLPVRSALIHVALSGMGGLRSAQDAQKRVA